MAGPERLEISPDHLTPPQQAYFGIINNLMDTLNADLAEFNGQVRSAAARLVVAASLTVVRSYAQQFNKNVLEYFDLGKVFGDILTPSDRKVSSSFKTDTFRTERFIQDGFMQNGKILVHKIPKILQRARDDLLIIAGMMEDSLMMDNDPYLGGMLAPGAAEHSAAARMMGTEWRIPAGTSSKDAIPKKRIFDPLPPETNVLNGYSTGSFMSLSGLPQKKRYIVLLQDGDETPALLCSGDVCPPSLAGVFAIAYADPVSGFFHASVVSAAQKMAAMSNGLSGMGKELFARQVRELDRLFPTAVLSPDKLAEQRAREDAERERRAAGKGAKRREGAPREDTRQRQRPVVSFAQSSRPASETRYVLPVTRGMKILLHCDGGNGVAAALKAEVEALQRLLDRRDPLHQATGDALLCEDMMSAALYFSGVENKKQRGGFLSGASAKDWQLRQAVSAKALGRLAIHQPATFTAIEEAAPLLVIINTADPENLRAAKKLAGQVHGADTGREGEEVLPASALLMIARRGMEKAAAAPAQTPRRPAGP